MVWLLVAVILLGFLILDLDRADHRAAIVHRAEPRGVTGLVAAGMPLSGCTGALFGGGDHWLPCVVTKYDTLTRAALSFFARKSNDIFFLSERGLILT